MECRKCGSKNISEVVLLTNEGSKLTDIESFACLECGHVELYLTARKMDSIKKQQSKNGPDQKNKESISNPFGW